MSSLFLVRAFAYLILPLILAGSVILAVKSVNTRERRLEIFLIYLFAFSAAAGIAGARGHSHWWNYPQRGRLHCPYHRHRPTRQSGGRQYPDQYQQSGPALLIYFLWALRKAERSPESEGNSGEFVHWQATQAALGGTTGAGVGIGLGTGIAVGQPLIGLILGLTGGLGLGLVLRRRTIGAQQVSRQTPPDN